MNTVYISLNNHFLFTYHVAVDSTPRIPTLKCMSVIIDSFGNAYPNHRLHASMGSFMQSLVIISHIALIAQHRISIITHPKAPWMLNCQQTYIKFAVWTSLLTSMCIFTFVRTIMAQFVWRNHTIAIESPFLL